MNNEELINFLEKNQLNLPKLAKNSTKKFNSPFNKSDQYYKLKTYIDDYINNKSEERFIVMPGLRGVGKTTVLFQLYEYLRSKNISNKDILYLSLDNLVNYFDITLIKIIDSYLKYMHNTDLVNLDKKLFLFIDEAHYNKSWPISGKTIYDQSKNILMIFTGSSAIDLQINKDLVRRVNKEDMHPMNFKQYLSLYHNINTSNNLTNSLENLILGNDSYEEVIKEEEIVQELIAEIDSKGEFKKFLISKNFPFSFNSNNEDKIHMKTFKMVNTIVDSDIPLYKSFNSNTNPLIKRIISYLALQHVGGTSNQKIASYLSASPTLVNEILSVLEESQLIFSIKPYGGAGKIIKKPWKYYFTSSSIKATINYEYGRYNLYKPQCMGNLLENMVASQLHKLMIEKNHIFNVFYPPEKGGVDFLIKTNNPLSDEIIPIEVGVGSKTKSQLVKAINRYDCNRGILISDRAKMIKIKGNVIYIPLMTFGFL